VVNSVPQLRKVISGAQTGVDQAALFAAESRGLHTGGFVCRGCKTLEGSRPELIARFNLIELSSSSYRERTRRNVLEADATVRIASHFHSAGERCTMRAVADFCKPHLDVTVRQGVLCQSASCVANWIASGGYEVINVAGNSEQTSPGIFLAAYKFLQEVFIRIRTRKAANV
jgi:hypothetical protein